MADMNQATPHARVFGAKLLAPLFADFLIVDTTSAD